jgi:hypothetical protein
MRLKAGVSLSHGEQPQQRRFSVRFDAFRARSLRETATDSHSANKCRARVLMAVEFTARFS